MFELKDLPNYETLANFAKAYDNPDVDGLHTWLLWASATSEMLTAFDANLSLHGLSQTQFFVLLLLKRTPSGLSIGALAEGVSVTSQTMTRVIDRMEAAGVCIKEADPTDRRVWIVRMAAPGDQLLGQALPSHYAWVARLMSRFNAKERSMLKQVMQKLRGPGVLG